jgi:RNA polymerase-interacting CarD/CdnL/TRCF family regulator
MERHELEFVKIIEGLFDAKEPETGFLREARDCRREAILFAFQKAVRAEMEPGRFDGANQVYRALVRHDGNSLCPDWSPKDRRELTEALDRLRLELLERKEMKP